MSVSPEFETIYSESFRSMTGEELSLPRNRTAHDSFVERATSDTMDSWTKHDKYAGITVLSASEYVENSHIVHPDHAAFNETDIHTIARVAFLGRTAIDTAKEQLRQNKGFMSINGRGPDEIFEYFQPYSWYVRHPNAPDTNKAEDPDQASPLRLRDWPNGRDVNCLGMSIAMAAACEQFGLTYVYANEIRNAQPVIAEQHANLMGLMRRLIPDFDDKGTKQILLEVMHCVREPDERYDNILFETPGILKVNDTVRDFHHFIISEYPEKSQKGAWVQIDPYDLSFDYLTDGRRQISTALSPLFEKGNENSVVLSDEYRMETAFFRRFSDQLRRAHDMTSDLVRRSKDGDAYKSQKFIGDMYTEAQDINRTVMNGLFSDQAEDAATDELLQLLYLCKLFVFATKVPNANEFVKNTSLPTNSSEGNAHIKEVEKRIGRAIEYDPGLRTEFIKAMAALPLLALVHTYEYNLKTVLQVRDVGTAGPVMEIADPEFMIGAMYMNHYATWRKSGRINVARHLSRICSSQLLWQAARQDECKVDDRIAAMGEVIKDLKPRQLHPLVNIASGIPIPN